MTDREEFEAAIANSPYRPPADKNGGLYKSIIAEAMWWAWQASRVAAGKRVAELVHQCAMKDVALANKESELSGFRIRINSLTMALRAVKPFVESLTAMRFRDEWDKLRKARTAMDDVLKYEDECAERARLVGGGR